MIKPKRNIAAGEPVYAGDIEDISSINLGIEVPANSAVVVLRSNGWRRCLFFDFGPINEPPVPRDYPLDRNSYAMIPTLLVEATKIIAHLLQLRPKSRN